MKKIIMVILFYFMRLFPINNKKIVFCQFLGKGYGDNCKYIAEALLEQGENYDLVWLVRPNAGAFPNGIRTVPYLSIRSIYEQVTARVWVDNCRKPEYVRKRKGQYYIMTWHSGIGLKQVEKDAYESLPDYYIRAAKNDSKMANLMLANSAWGVNRFRRAFWYDGEIAIWGQPREDFLFNYTKEQRQKIRQRIGISDNQKFLLYAPTFRQSQQNEFLKEYELNWEKLLKCMETKMGGKWIGGLRLHPDISYLEKNMSCGNEILGLTSYPDIQELLVACDAMITDYSSCMFDTLLLGKPTFLYAKDMVEYWKDRKFYFTLEELPFSVAQSQEELNKNILEFNISKFNEDRQMFYKNIGCVPGGKAAEMTANRIRKEIYGVES